MARAWARSTRREEDAVRHPNRMSISSQERDVSTAITTIATRYVSPRTKQSLEKRTDIAFLTESYHLD